MDVDLFMSILAKDSYNLGDRPGNGSQEQAGVVTPEMSGFLTKARFG